ncbi:helix-turn-helix domain-containing protein [Phytohabitans rumicis]|nr:helix-turn-helix transcriptional regulator [Phytohabitans rumicis]
MGDVHDPLSVPASFWTRADVAGALSSRDVGALFTLLRRYVGASQHRIGVAVDIEQGTVSKIVKGKRSVVAIDVLERIANGLGMPDTARCMLGLAPTGLALPGTGADSRDGDQDDRSGSRDRPARHVKAANHRLDRLIHEAGMSRAALARYVNELGVPAGLDLSYDYTSVYRWINKGERPRNPTPRLIASILMQRLRRPISVADIGMGDVEDAASSEPVCVASVPPVWVSVSAGGAIEVVCPDDAAGPVAIVARGIRVLIDTSGMDPAPVTPAVVDEPSLPGGARVYSLAERRAR